MPFRSKTEWLWTLLVLAPIVLGFWWIPGGRSGRSDSYSAEAAGKKALFDLLEELDYEIERHVSGVPPRRDDIRTLCIIGPTRKPHPGEWRRLVSWVENGGHLIFAPRHGDPAVTIEDMDLAIERRALVRVGQDETSAGTDGGGAASSDAEQETGEVASQVETTLVEKPFDWRSRGSIEVVDWQSDWYDALLRVDGDLQVGRFYYGDGVVTLVASDQVFTNFSLARGRDPFLAFRILEAGLADSGVIAFDENLNAGGGPKVVGLLFDPLLRPITLQVLLCCAVFLWMGSRRFGAVRKLRHERRRSILEHARALGNLYYKTGAASRALESYVEFVRFEEYRGRRGSSGNGGVSGAVLHGERRQKFQQALRAAEHLAASGRASASEAADLVQELAELRRGETRRSDRQREPGTRREVEDAPRPATRTGRREPTWT